MSERKILDLAKPILRTWSSGSNLESIALLQENAIEWMFDNYINLIGHWSYQGNSALLAFIPENFPIIEDMSLSAWLRCPFLSFYYVSHDFVRNRFDNILEYIMFVIEEGYYIYLDMFQETLSVRIGTKYHRTFIYGFDKKRRILYVTDHYNRGKYALAELGFDEFLNTYEFTYWDNDGCKLTGSGKKIIRERQQITVAKPKSFQYEFNVDWFKLQLKDYLDATYRLHCAAVITETEGYKRYFGIGSYDLAMDYLEMLIEDDREIVKDWKVFTLICDHKKLLRMRLDFFQERGICNFSREEKIKYDMLYRSSEVVLNLFIKYRVSRKTEPLKKMKEILKSMKSTESELLRELLNKL